MALYRLTAPGSAQSRPGTRVVLCLLLSAASTFAAAAPPQEDGFHVYPGQNIQEALQAAAANPTQKVVKVHAGTYAPQGKRQALIWFNRSHDGIHLQAVGGVTLTAANPDLASRTHPAYPAIVNHVVYFGDGISSNTVLQGFRITGANHFVTEKLTEQMEPDSTVPKNLFFYTDGGAIKVFGRSSPVIREVEVVNNYASPCGAGISIQQQGRSREPVSILNCILRGNRTQVTGAAVDLLEGSAAVISNCLFTANISNTGKDTVAWRSGEPPFTNSGVLTIFQKSRALIQNCTFAGNRNGVDDMGGASVYRNCIFHGNTLEGGLTGGARYALELSKGGTVAGCFIQGRILDPQKAVSPANNFLEPVPPDFDGGFVPRSEKYREAGYRPLQPRMRE